MRKRNPGISSTDLQSGFMFYAEAQNGTWAFSSDLLYMKLKQDVVPTAVISSGSVTMSETSWELAGDAEVPSVA